MTLFVTVDRKAPQTEKQVKKQLKLMAKHWERLLYLTGGKLELTKCFWIPITWKWKRGEPCLISRRGCGVKLTLTESESGTKIVIPRINHNQAEKRLGVRYSVDGSWKSEFNFWIQYSSKFATKIRQARLDRLSGEHAYKTFWCSKFRYCAPIVSFTKSQLQRIQQKVIGSSLTAAGFNSKMPHAVVFGPAKLGGLNWESPYSIMLNSQINLLMGSIRTQDTVGKMIILQLSWLQIFAGTSTLILEEHKEIPYIPKCWIQSLHDKLIQTNIQIKIAGVWSPSARRQEDQVIMDYVRKKLPETMWGSINQCRLYLNAVTFSDIITFDGTTIPDQIYKVKKKYRTSRLQYPSQKRPPKPAIQHWQYFIKFIADKHHRLYLSLGKWLDTPYQLYPYCINTSSTLLYQKRGSTWHIFYKVSATRNRFNDGNLTTRKLPSKWTPVNVIKRQNGIIQAILPAEKNMQVEVSTEIEDSIEFEMSKILGKFWVNHEELRSLRARWQVQPIVLVCGTDGGLKGRIGASGYVIYLEAGQSPLIRGYAAEEQVSGNGSSTRQELLAQLCVEYWIIHLLKKLGEPDSPIRVQVVTDSQASIQIREGICTAMSMTNFLKPDVDVAMELHRCRSENKHSNLEFHKVKSHILEVEAPDENHWRLNKEADDLATDAREAVEAGQLQAQKPQFLNGARVMCIAQGNLCTSNVKDFVYDSIYSNTMENFLCNKYNWTQRVFNTVDWENHHSALAKYHGLQKVTVFKYIHGWLATKKRRYREGRFSTSQCELCSETEDSIHIFCCQNESIREARRLEFWALKTKIRQIMTPEVYLALEAGLGSIGGEGNHRYADEFVPSREIEVAFRDQNEIGWDNFAKGRIAKAWSLLESTDSNSTENTRGLVTITKGAIDYGLKLWNHRNKLVNGNDPRVSKIEIQKIQRIVEILYDELSSIVDGERKWLFERDKAPRMNDSYTLQVAWIDSVRRIFPKEYGELKVQWGEKSYTEGEVSYQKERRSQT